jgi:hypothetical protein
MAHLCTFLATAASVMVWLIEKNIERLQRAVRPSPPTAM